MLKLQRLLYFILVFSALQNSTCLCAMDITETEGFIYAKSMILVRDQVSLTARDILEDTEDSRNYFNVFNVDLSDFNFSSSDAGKIIDYFNNNLLPNLRVIGLFNAKNVPYFIRSLFSDPKDRFYSLIRIDASRSDINLAELDVLFDYFNDSQCLIRDMEQTSSRLGGLAASLSVDIIAADKGIHKFTDHYISTHYRVGSIRDAIFMIVKQ